MKDNNTKNTNDAEAIKKDVKDIMDRISKFDKNTLKVLYEDSSELFNQFKEVKDKVVGSNESNLKEMVCSCIGRNPVISAITYIGIGAIMAMFLKR